MRKRQKVLGKNGGANIVEVLLFNDNKNDWIEAEKKKRDEK